jgi:iron(III) transport system substrate-binding protein
MSRLKRYLTALLGCGATLCITGVAAAPELNLYSARKEALIQPLLERFTEQTGVKVNLVTGKADALLKRLKSEGRNSPADILLTTDAGRLHRAKEAGLTQPFSSELLNSVVPGSYHDPQGHWVGLSVRSRPILYVKGKVDPATLSSYEALAEPKWKQRICIRSSSNIYNQSLVASMIAANGEAATEVWAKGLVANLARPPKGGDRDQIKAAAAGQCDIAIANTYYLAGMLNSKKPDQRAAAEKMGVFWPNQEDRGAHVNVSGAAVTRSSKNPEMATKLIEFLASDASQQWYAEINGEYPVRAGVATGTTLKGWGEFKADTLNLDRLGELNANAVMLMDRAKWR